MGTCKIKRGMSPGGGVGCGWVSIGKGSSPVEFNWIGAGPFILKGKIVKRLLFDKLLTNLPFILKEPAPLQLNPTGEDPSPCQSRAFWVMEGIHFFGICNSPYSINSSFSTIFRIQTIFCFLI